MSMTTIKTYSELITLPTFEERFCYLKLDGSVGRSTFGYDRYLNQQFYTSQEWKSIRDFVIIRDNGCDMALDGYELRSRIYIHHMNPILSKDVIHRTDFLTDPEYLVCVSFATHNAIHYCDESILKTRPVERKQNDMCPWRH